MIYTCCSKQEISTLHDEKSELIDGRYQQTPCVNKCCLKCFTHWYGEPDKIRKYTSKEWDTVINSCFDAEPLKLSDYGCLND